MQAKSRLTDNSVAVAKAINLRDFLACEEHVAKKFCVHFLSFVQHAYRFLGDWSDLKGKLKVVRSKDR